MDKDLKFRISLEDLFSKGIQNAEHHAEGFDNHVISIREHLSALSEKAVEAFGIFESFEFLKESAEKFVEADKAAAQLSFTVGSRGGLAGDLQELTEQSEKLGKSSFFNHVEITKAQNDLLNFGISVNKTKESIKSLTDVGVAKGVGLEELIQKIAGAAATGQTRSLNRSGFGLGQLKLEKAAGNLAAENRNFEKIMEALGGKFAGATDSFANKDFFKLKKIEDEFDDFKEKVGKELLVAFDALLPYLKEGIEYLTEIGHFVKENAGLIKELAVTVAGGAAAFYLINTASSVAAIAVKTFNAELEITPLGAFIAAAALLAKQLYDAKDAWDKLEADVNKEARTAIDEERQQVEALTKAYEKKYKTVAEAQAAAIAFEKSELQRSYIEAQSKADVDMKVSERFGHNISGLDLDALQAKALASQKIATELKVKLNSLGNLDNFATKPKSKGESDLGTGLSEPKASKIQNITFNIIEPLKGQRVTVQGDLSDIKNIGQNFVEFFTSLVQDSAIIATE